MTVKRITGRTLQTLRARLLYDEPLCVHCTDQGRLSLAVEVDHIIPLYKGGSNDQRPAPEAGQIPQPAPALSATLPEIPPRHPTQQKPDQIQPFRPTVLHHARSCRRRVASHKANTVMLRK